ncbi:MAG: hypothetical protein LBU74_05325 [Methanobacteriaceae archaeon]|nr:hypothetical protein [Candidatus Methanorudis spinitermitis]
MKLKSGLVLFFLNLEMRPPNSNQHTVFNEINPNFRPVKLKSGLVLFFLNAEMRPPNSNQHTVL